MPKIAARKCPRTGKLFETDKKYRKHIVGLRKKLNASRPRKIALRKSHLHRQALIADVRAEIATLRNISEVESYMRNHFGKIMIAFNGGTTPELHAKLSELKMIEFNLDVKFSDRTSNSHAQPRDGVSNWCGRDPERPKHYPGWSGHIDYELNFDPSQIAGFSRHLCRSGDGLKFVGVTTGTGGGRGPRGVYKYSYGVTLFLSDFEGMQKQYFHDKLAGTVNSR